ncbi:site-specific integrase [Paraglaciecola sp. MB-3u-78]|uniref:tyrosine-type recombinase/integrase n=1 Tax=Paraglaciecola sp. MB-3u-78 TaxID=2058332 RepID=UPI000C34D841|nr:site-specific integrase [Paraglaciecola sp. MB-3u-78]PKG93143.1 integrase [Paraglaciecola sp. MB-3u-78]
MSTQIDRHSIDDALYIYLQDNSKKWYARFQLFGKWYCKSTKEVGKDQAIAKAQLLRMEWKIKAETGTLTKSKRFRDVAEKAIACMELELANGGGIASYREYIHVLKRYHVTFFDRIYITSIDHQKLREFDVWRTQQAKRELTKSTILTHNAAMQMVFKQAIENQWMLPIQVPVLSNKGVQGTRRASFTPDEYEHLVFSNAEMMKNSRKQVTADIRQLLFCYMEFAINSGLRPGTELDHLTWGDIQVESHDHKSRFFITVRKGKTTKHTGTRQVVCKQGIFDVIQLLILKHKNRKATDLLFRLPNGDTTNELGPTFSRLLKECDMKESPSGTRTLYSLRHTYITWELMAQSVSIDVLARQCGTSIQMIEQHYSHVVPKMFSNQLSGMDMPVEAKEIKDRFDVPDKTKELFAKKAKAWADNYRKRGCI